MDQNSEVILTQILLLVQDLHRNLDEYGQRVAAIEQNAADLNERINVLIVDGFPEGDYRSHRIWHEQRRYGPFRRFLLRLIA